MEQFRGTLDAGLQGLNLTLSSDQVDSILAYFELLLKWNRHYNLSAIRDPKEVLHKHLLDSLAVLPYLGDAQRLIDVGTGGGLPGIPLAICSSSKHVTLLDSVGKKTRFLFHVKQCLQLDNIEIVNRRVESYQPAQKYHGILTRAFSSLRAMVRSCQHLLHKDGKFFAMKGLYPQAELSELEKHYIVDDIHPLNVPGVTGERCLVMIRPQRE